MSQKDENPYKNSFSDYIRDKYDKEIIDYLNHKYIETKQIINDNKDSIEKIKDSLLKNETLYYDDLVKIIDI